MAIKQIKLHTIFIQYLVSLCIGFVIIIMLFASGFQFLINLGIVVPANYTETLIGESRESIEKATQITKEIIPSGCEYAIFDKNGHFLSGSMSKEAANKAWQLVKNESNTGGVKHYALMKGKNEFCILQYYLLPQFASNFLRAHLPDPQSIMIIIFAIVIILEILLVSAFFGRYINKKLISLKNAAQKIQKKDLDFSVEYSRIKEIDDVLCSLDNMKTELNNSLKEQWNIEQTKKEQISALAHDIKTPLTIIKGNSELLIDSELNNEEKEYVHFIAKNVKVMEEYIKTVIEISNTEKALSVQIHNVDSHEFVTTIHNQLNALATAKKLKVEFLEYDLPSKMNIDQKLLYRGIMNVISNAVDHSPYEGTIVFEVKSINNIISFKITDSGKGFSNEDIKFVTKQFYMGDASRAAKSHYGMGLYITQNIVNQHKGSLYIANSKIMEGGEVTIEVPIIGIY